MSERKLTRRYVSALSLLGALLLTDYVVFISFINGTEKDGYLINISGRQRMLSQHIPLLKTTKNREHDPVAKARIQNKLEAAAEAMDTAHKTLLEAKGHVPAFHEVYYEEPHWLNQRMGEFLSQARLADDTDLPLELSDGLLETLEHAVNTFQTENSAHQEMLIKIQQGILVSGVLVLLLSGLLIFKPMAQLLLVERKHVKLLMDVATIANRATTLDEALEKTVQLIRISGDFPVGHAYVIDEKTPLIHGTGLPGRVLEQGKPVWITDVTQDRNFPRNKIASDIGVRSAFAFPVLVRGRTVAVLEFFSDEVIEKNARLLHIISHTGEHLGQVCEREQSDLALKRERDAADKANQTKSIFLANISHELRTPMHGILSFSRFGMQKIDSAPKEKLATYFEEIHDSGSQLMTLLNDLLDLSKLEAGKIEYSIREWDLVELAISVRSEMRAFAEENDVTLEMSEGRQEMRGHFDGPRIMQVLRNLISNAIKFSDKNTAVRMDFERQSDHIVCRVSNHGMGIPPSELESIFDKFVQSSKTRTGAGGTGLGLAICREIVKQHGGKIRAQSEPNGDTQFIIELPNLKQAA